MDSPEEDQPEEERISITIDVSSALYAKFEAAAAEEALSVSEYLERIVEQYISDKRILEEQNGHPVPPDFLEKVYRLREQILRESKGHTFEDTAEEIRHMREERTLELESRMKPLTREKLERVLKVHEEINTSTGGRTFDDSTELIRQMREERTKELNEQ